MEKTIYYVCTECGSSDIVWDAVVSWDDELQKVIILEDLFKSSYCNYCEDTCSVEEVVLDE